MVSVNIPFVLKDNLPVNQVKKKIYQNLLSGCIYPAYFPSGKMFVKV